MDFWAFKFESVQGHHGPPRKQQARMDHHPADSRGSGGRVCDSDPEPVLSGGAIAEERFEPHAVVLKHSAGLVSTFGHVDVLNRTRLALVSATDHQAAISFVPVVFHDSRIRVVAQSGAGVP